MRAVLQILTIVTVSGEHGPVLRKSIMLSAGHSLLLLNLRFGIVCTGVFLAVFFFFFFFVVLTGTESSPLFSYLTNLVCSYQQNE